MNTELIVNPTNAREVEHLVVTVRRRAKRCRITIVNYAPRRTDRQNRFYWPAFATAVSNFLNEQGESYSPDDIHEMWKLKFLRLAVVIPRTGEQIGWRTRSTTELTTTEFNEYLDKCAAWMWDKLGIPLPDPTRYHELEPARGRHGVQVRRVPNKQLPAPVASTT